MAETVFRGIFLKHQSEFNIIISCDQHNKCLIFNLLPELVKNVCIYDKSTCMIENLKHKTWRRLHATITLMLSYFLFSSGLIFLQTEILVAWQPLSPFTFIVWKKDGVCKRWPSCQILTLSLNLLFLSVWNNMRVSKWWQYFIFGWTIPLRLLY